MRDWRVLAWCARLSMVVLAGAAAVAGDATALALALVLLAGSLVVSRLARPAFDAALALLLAAHGWAILAGLAGRVWGPFLHLVAPALVAGAITLIALERRPARPTAADRSRAGLVGVAGGLLVIVAWELAELALNEIPGVSLHVDRADTQHDLALGALGVVVGAGLTGALVRPRAPRAARLRRAAR
jgi:hypothetical protein